MNSTLNRKIVTGKLRLIDNGWLQVDPSSGAEIHIQEPVSIRIIFHFPLFNEQGETKVAGKALDDQTLELTLERVNNVLGFGSAKPILIGTLNGQQLFLSYSVSPFGDSISLRYAFYIEEDTDAR
jgi:hypothetical protein